MVATVATSVATSMTASLLLSWLFEQPVTLMVLFRAFIIPFSIAVAMTAIWMDFLRYLRQTQSALRTSEAKNYAILQALPDLMLHLDLDGRFLDYHVPRSADLPESPEVFLGKTVHDFFPKALADDMLMHVQRALDAGTIELLEYESFVNGSGRFSEARLATLDDNTVLAIVRDITARKNAQSALAAERASLAQRVEERTAALRETNNQLVAALRTRDEFLANVSHELRTPLTAILAFSDLLLRQLYGPLNARQRQALADIRDSGKHLLAVINDVLEFSRIETGQPVLDLQALDVASLCQDSVKLVEHVAKQKGVQISLDVDADVATVVGDERRMKQMLVNLLDNAVKFTPAGGAVGLEVRGDAGTNTMHFTVWDTGIGIAEADIERVFQPFVQLDSSLSRQYEGVGLGLALVYFLVELQGGSVSVTSKVGQGSRFTLTLPWERVGDGALKPASLEQMEAGLLTESPPELHDHPLILVAEDNRLNRQVICEALATKGYRVITAHDGTMAVQAAREHHPDLILMDIQMPGVDGLEAMRLIRADAALHEIPIIAVTALAMPGDRERCIGAGAIDYLSKPIEVLCLLDAARKALTPGSDHNRA